jgi:hypothetical protein
MRVLDRVTDLVRRDRDRRKRAPVVMGLQQADTPAFGIVVVAAIGGLDLDVLQVVAVEQMAGEFPAGALQVGAVLAVPVDGESHPSLRQDDDGNQRDEEENHRRAPVIGVRLRPRRAALARIAGRPNSCS